MTPLRHIPEGVRYPAFGIFGRRTSLEESCKNHIVKKQKFASSFEVIKGAHAARESRYSPEMLPW